MRYEFKTHQPEKVETIKNVRVGITECASHSNASKLLSCDIHNISAAMLIYDINGIGGRSTTIISGVI